MGSVVQEAWAGQASWQLQGWGILWHSGACHEEGQAGPFQGPLLLGAGGGQHKRLPPPPRPQASSQQQSPVEQALIPSWSLL